MWRRSLSSPVGLTRPDYYACFPRIYPNWTGRFGGKKLFDYSMLRLDVGKTGAPSIQEDMKNLSIPILAAAVLTAGCSDEYLDCVNAWQACDCPPSGPAIAAAEAAYDLCMEHCPVLDPNSPEQQQLAAGRCIKACGDARNEAIEEATACQEQCDDEFDECTGAILGCSDPTSTQYLEQVLISTWSANDPLVDPQHGIFVCEDHFPLFSTERNEVVQAIQQYDQVEGSDIGFFTLSQPHQDKSVLFADPPAASTFDYVDNANDTFVHACHPDNTTACFDNDALGINGFAINTCSYADGEWKGAGDRDFFSITANANCYTYFTDPTSSDYVKDTGALHELGHAAGMNHTNSWPVDDQIYISTMQGNLKYLSAYDVKFLRDHYSRFTGANLDFVASSKIRIDFGGANPIIDTFAKENPDRLYLVGDVVYDCSTQAPAVFYAAWFNTGENDQEADHCMINELRLEQPSAAHEAKIVSWHAAQMPSESQDQWVGGSNTVASDFVGLSRGVDLDLVFEVNVYEQYRERSTNNIVRTPVKLYDTSACVPPSPLPPAPAAPIRKIGATSYDITGQYLNQVTANPLAVARGVTVVPAPVGGMGLGLKLKAIEEGSPLFLMGAQVGDILWRVDGQPITGLSTAINALNKVKNGGTVVIGYARANTMRSASYKKR